MSLPHPSPRQLTVVLAMLAAAGGMRAELLKISPFLQAPGSANAPTANAPLEYRGSMEMDNEEQFRVVDPQHKVGTWLKVGEKDANLDVALKQYDKDHDTITVEHGGQSMTLQLKVPKVIAGAAAPQLMPPPPQFGTPNVSPAVISTVVTNPTPADEQRRLEAVAAEVARRRAIREQQAQQQMQQAGAPAVQPMPPNVTRQDLQQQPQQPPVGRRAIRGQ